MYPPVHCITRATCARVIEEDLLDTLCAPSMWWKPEQQMSAFPSARARAAEGQIEAVVNDE